jgi:hypothetical protein
VGDLEGCLVGGLTERLDMEVSRYYNWPSFDSDSGLEEGKYVWQKSR